MKRLAAIVVAFLVTACATPSITPAVVDQAANAVVSLEFKQNQFGADFPNGPKAFCSGVVIAADRVLTNRHCAEADPSRQVWIRFRNDTLVKAVLVGTSDLPFDAAIYSIDPRAVIQIAKVSDTAVAPGDEVFAVGMPLGLRWTVTRGIVSATNRMLELDDETAVEISRGPWIQVDAALNPGNSGGALFNARGELVGINTLKANTDGIGFSIPIADVLREIAKFL